MDLNRRETTAKVVKMTITAAEALVDFIHPPMVPRQSTVREAKAFAMVASVEIRKTSLAMIIGKRARPRLVALEEVALD